MTDTIPARLAALKTMPMPDLKAQWRDLFDTDPPPFNRRYLENRIAYRIQELAYGGLKPETIRRLEILGEQYDSDNVTTRRTRHDARPVVGTRLVREYQRIEHTVTVLADGYEWEGRPYRSLSAIARAITGTRWNGLVFFGLKNQRRHEPRSRGQAGPQAPLRDLHPQVERGRPRAGVQLASMPSARPARPMWPASAPRAGR